MERLGRFIASGATESIPSRGSSSSRKWERSSTPTPKRREEVPTPEGERGASPLLKRRASQ